MRRAITQRQLRNDSGQVLRHVQAGNCVVVTRNGMPIAELRPVRPRQFVARATIAASARLAPRINARKFRRELDSIVNPYVRA